MQCLEEEEEQCSSLRSRGRRWRRSRGRRTRRTTLTYNMLCSSCTVHHKGYLFRSDQHNCSPRLIPAGCGVALGVTLLYLYVILLVD